MKIVIAPDSFKGSLTARQAANAIADGIKRVIPNAELLLIPMADGGEGTTQTLTDATAGNIYQLNITGPLGKTARGFFGILGTNTPKSNTLTPHNNHATTQITPLNAPRNKKAAHTASTLPACPATTTNPKQKQTAIIEIAAAAGLPLLSENERNPLNTTTYGVGELIIAALQKGCRTIILGLGGSATSDCGTGMAQALGTKFYDKTGNIISSPITAGTMGQIYDIDPTAMIDRLTDVKIIIACDVKNPLTGPNGAARVYGPQKCSSNLSNQQKQAIIGQIEANTRHFADILEAKTGKNIRNIPGSGAAGGLAAPLLAFTEVTLERGIDIVIRYSHLADALTNANLIITGEGRIDRSTAFGKTIAGIARMTMQHNSKNKTSNKHNTKIPIIALAGSISPDAQQLLTLGIVTIPICPGPVSLSQALNNAETFLSDTTERTMQLITLNLPRL